MRTSIAALAAAGDGGDLFPGTGINSKTLIAWIIGIAVLLLAVGGIGIIAANKDARLSVVMTRLAIMAVGVVVLAVAIGGGFWALGQQAGGQVVQGPSSSSSGGK